MELENSAHAKIHGTGYRIRRAGEIDDPRLRIATLGEMKLRGHGVVSQRNNAVTLAFKVSGIDDTIYLNTLIWKISWAEDHG